jgi:hypothetical protein
VVDPKPVRTLGATVPPLLPLWPLFVMFGLVPLWWLAGVFFLGWTALGAMLFLPMVVRGRIPLPPGSGIWLIFLALAALSATQLAAAANMLTFSLRLGFYVTALLVGTYVYAATRERRDLSPVLTPLAAFWLGLVVLGWSGVVAPRFGMVTPVELLLPGGIAAHPFIQDVVHVQTTEFSARSLNPVYRPAAPFPYTNNYGSAYAMTLPCMVAFTMLRRPGALRTAVLVSLPLSLPPAFLTLNRGMFLSLGVGLAVLGVQAMLRGNLKVAASIGGLVAIGALATVFIPIADLINERVSASNTNTDRMALYLEVLGRVGESPLLGFGAPVNVDTVSADAPIGTQGQMWMVLFSHGVPALLCFVCWFVVALLVCIRAPSAAGQWLGVVPLICLVQVPFYGMANQNLAVAFYAICFAMALVERERGPAGRPTAPAVAVTAGAPVTVADTSPAAGVPAVPVGAGAGGAR